MLNFPIEVYSESTVYFSQNKQSCSGIVKAWNKKTDQAWIELSDTQFMTTVPISHLRDDPV